MLAAVGHPVERLHDRTHAVDEVGGLVQILGDLNLQAVVQVQRLWQGWAPCLELAVQQIVVDVGLPVRSHAAQGLLAKVGKQQLNAEASDEGRGTVGAGGHDRVRVLAVEAEDVVGVGLVPAADVAQLLLGRAVQA